MLGKKFLQARLQQCMSQELPDVQPWFRKGKGPEIKLPTSLDYRKTREFQKNIFFCFINYTKGFDCVDHNKLENSSRDVNTRPPDLPPKKSVCRSRNSS